MDFCVGLLSSCSSTVVDVDAADAGQTLLQARAHLHSVVPVAEAAAVAAAAAADDDDAEGGDDDAESGRALDAGWAEQPSG